MDNFVGVAGDYNVFQFTPSTLQGTDTITGGATGGFFDVMVAQAAGTIGAAQFTGVTNIEGLFLSSGGNDVTLTNGLLAGSSFGFFAVIDGGGSDVVDASAITATPIVYYAAAGADTFKGGQANDVVFIAPANLSSADTIQGGTGIDTFSFNAAGTVAASAFTNVTGFEISQSQQCGQQRDAEQRLRREQQHWLSRHHRWRWQRHGECKRSQRHDDRVFCGRRHRHLHRRFGQ